MLNAWFHGTLGFHAGVRASAGLTGGLMIIALFLMKPRYLVNGKKTSSTLRYFRLFLQDFPYVIMILGWAKRYTASGPEFIMNSAKTGRSSRSRVYIIQYSFFSLMPLRMEWTPIWHSIQWVFFFLPNGEHDSHLSIFPSLRFWMERVAWAVLYRICWFTGWVLSILSPLAFLLRPSSCSVLLPSRTRQVQWFLLFCMDFFLDLVSESPTPSSMVMILMVLDASVIPAVVGSTADTDSEIGARLGVCFTFTGQANSSNLATRADKLIICYPIRFRGTYRYVPLNWKNKYLRDLPP